MWVCGLKPHRYGNAYTGLTVAPYVGVWIETPGTADTFQYPSSHPMWVCGLKQ